VRDPGVAHLARIILAPDARGQGLGTTLCELLMAEAAHSTGAGAFTLRVYRDNDPALAIYERLGFAVVPGLSDERGFFDAQTGLGFRSFLGRSLNCGACLLPASRPKLLS
jgi:ribosomal protein S18 acetylase RimI-like enzyme